MILHTLIAILLFLIPAVQVEDEDDTNVFVDLGTEHCANRIAIAAYENLGDEELPAQAQPDFITYSGFEFDTALEANAAFDDLPELVVETFSDDLLITEGLEADELVTEITAEERGDRSAAYIITLPENDIEDDVLTIEMLSVIKQNQLVMILMFSERGTAGPGPGLSLETIPPFADTLEDDWTGYGDLEDAIPEEEEMPIDWIGQDITTGELPPCEQDQ